MSEKLIMGSAAKEIPSEVAEDILVRLPVKSLLRFRSLNKYFSSLILENPTFVHKQLHYRCQQSISGFDHALVMTSSNDQQFFLVDSTNQLRRPLVKWEYSPPSFLCESDSNFVGHCDGLICFRATNPMNNNNMVFSLWNPILRQYKNLPKSGIILCGHYDSKNCLGFGHDPKSRDYKLVRLAFQFRNMQAQVYSLRAGSWRKVVHNLAYNINCGDETHDSVCLGGFCYWFLEWSTMRHNEHVILLFDLSNEVFHVMKLPELMSRQLSAGRTKLMEWDKSVALVSYPSEEGRETKFLDVWLLNDVENQKLDSNNGTISVKRYFVSSINDPLDRFRELMLIWNNEKILNHIRVDSRNRDHLTTRETLNDDYGEGERCSQYFKIVGYTKSLVSII